MFAGIANADTLITYSVAIGPATQDLTGTSSTGITGFHPGGTVPTFDTTPSVTYPGSLAGVTMSSVPTNAVLQSYDIDFQATVTGTFTVTNNTMGTFGNTAFVSVTDEAALGLSSGPLFRTNDVFTMDPAPSKTIHLTGLASGASTSVTYSSSATADTGAITTGLASVKSPNDPLALYLQSLTSSSQAGLASSHDFTYANTFSGIAYITYDYTIPSGVPEPTTMVLFGSALVGLGLLRKRVRG